MAKPMEEKIGDLLQESGLEEMEEEILSTLIPCVVIQPAPEEEELPVGASKFGGLPDLPAGEAYPEEPGRLYSFLAQYNLRELDAAGVPHSLPENGMLYFFLSLAEVHPDAPLAPGAWKVFLRETEAEELRPVPFPEEMPRELLIPERGITFAPEKQLPDVEATQDMEDMYFHLMDQLYDLEERIDGYHQAFGQPLELSGDVFTECSLNTGVPREDWVLLLQVDSDPDVLERDWGGLGMLYFCIPREDLAARRFDRVWLAVQSH